MGTATIAGPEIETLRDLLDRLGNIPLERIRFHPAPGTATEADVLVRPHWDHFPNRELPAQPIPDLVPDLAVEVLSEGNTEPEMERKLREYFRFGVRLVWYVDPRTRTARVYTSSDDVRLLHEDDALDGGAVLPGFHLKLRDLFDRARKRRSE